MYINQKRIRDHKNIILATTGLLLYLIIYFVFLSLFKEKILVISSNIMSVTGLSVSLLIMVFSISRHNSKSMKNMWNLFALGIFFNILGDVVWSIGDAMNNLESVLFIADILYIVQTILFVIAIYKFAFRKGNPKRILKSIDILIGALILIIIELKYIIIPVYSLNLNRGISAYLSVIYPVADLIVLIILVMIILRPSEKKKIKVIRLMFIPMIINIIANQAYLLQVINNNYSTGNWLDPLWPMAAWILAIIAMISAEEEKTISENEDYIVDFIGVRQSIRNIIVLSVYIAFTMFGIYVFSRYLIIDVLSVGFIIIISILIMRDMFYSLSMGKLFEKIKVVNKDLENLNEKLDIESKTDYMTGLNNRRQIMNIYYNLKKHTLKEASLLSVIMIDIDYFKKINDNYGHEAGDKVLKNISDLLLENTRDKDHVGRFGGEEFLILMPECDKENAFRIAERIRIIIEKTPISIDNKGTTVNVTISVGISCLDSKKDVDNDTINEADKALYLAKDKGRNQVIKFNLAS